MALDREVASASAGGMALDREVAGASAGGMALSSEADHCADEDCDDFTAQ